MVSTRKAARLTHKYYTRLESITRDKHSSLFISDNEKSFYDILTSSVSSERSNMVGAKKVEINNKNFIKIRNDILLLKQTCKFN
jgi:hypothetical protein